MIKNKKGTTSFASGLSILEILLEIFVVLSVIFLISGSLLKNLDSRDSQSIIIALTPLYSTAGMSYYDEDLTRVIVGTIDISKFNDETLENSMHMPDNKIVAAKFTIYDTNNNEIKSAHYNKEWYELWKPLLGYPGAGGSQSVITERYVLLKDSSIKKSIKKKGSEVQDAEEIDQSIDQDTKNQKTIDQKAILKIEVITPNS